MQSEIHKHGISCLYVTSKTNLKIVNKAILIINETIDLTEMLSHVKINSNYMHNMTVISA